MTSSTPEAEAIASEVAMRTIEWLKSPEGQAMIDAIANAPDVLHEHLCRMSLVPDERLNLRFNI